MRHHLAQHPEKQEKAPGAASGPPVMIQAVQLWAPHHHTATGYAGAEPVMGSCPFWLGRCFLPLVPARIMQLYSLPSAGLVVVPDLVETVLCALAHWTCCCK